MGCEGKSCIGSRNPFSFGGSFQILMECLLDDAERYEKVNVNRDLPAFLLKYGKKSNGVLFVILT